MNVTMAYCKRLLAIIWFCGAGLLFFLVLLQTVLGRYGGRASDVWGWLLPTVMPTLSLVIGVLAMDALGKGVKSMEAEPFLFKLTFGISLAYLVAVLLIILLQPLSPLSPFDLMNQANLWLGPFQGLVAAAMGAFFVKAPPKGATKKH
jgi:hypothetical protein